MEAAPSCNVCIRNPCNFTNEISHAVAPDDSAATNSNV
jgi:hypothetical protein